jgi:uridylate kinase
MDRASADYVGMLATVMNAIALQQALVDGGVEARVQTAIPMSPIAEPYVRERALSHLENRRVVVFAAGTGSPFFTTDTAASLRAVEMGADLLLKATQVDGVYDRDPNRYEGAHRYDEVSYDEILSMRLDVMDATAIALCREHRVPLRIFNIRNKGCLQRIVMGDNNESTLVYGRTES